MDNVVVIHIVDTYTFVIISSLDHFIRCRVYLHIVMVLEFASLDDTVALDKLSLVERNGFAAAEVVDVRGILALGQGDVLSRLVLEDKQMLRLFLDVIFGLLGAVQYQRVVDNLEIDRQTCCVGLENGITLNPEGNVFSVLVYPDSL